MNDESLDGIENDLSKTDGQAGGPFSARVEALLSDRLSGARVFLTTSCTSALEMASILAGVRPGDVVVVPAFGFVTTALAFVRSGARIRFADIEDTTLGIDPDSVAAAMDQSVRAVTAIHYAGIPCEIEKTREIVRGSPMAMLIEDNAHGLFGSTAAGRLGTFGELSALSFHSTKNVSCGEGGALVVNDDSLIDRAQVIFEKGTDRRDFINGVVDKYVWRDLGSSFGLSDYLAAVLYRRLVLSDQAQAKRTTLAGLYDAILGPEQATLGFKVPQHPEGSISAHHLYYILLATPDLRGDLLSKLKGAGIGASSHFVPLHLTPGGEKWSVQHPPCPVSERVAASIVRLPLHQDMSPAEIERISTEALRLLKAMR